MDKYLIDIEFRFNGKPDNRGNVYKNKTITLGICDNIEEACTIGNKCLEKLEKQFKLNIYWDRKERFSLNNYLIGDLAYLQTPFQFFASIKTLEFTPLEDTIKNVMEDIKGYRDAKNKENEENEENED